MTRKLDFDIGLLKIGECVSLAPMLDKLKECCQAIDELHKNLSTIYLHLGEIPITMHQIIDDRLIEFKNQLNNAFVNVKI